MGQQVMRVTVTQDHLYTPGGSLPDETGQDWTMPVPSGPVEPTLRGEVYDDDMEHYYSIKVEGMPLDDEEWPWRVYDLFARHAGATVVRYAGRPDLLIG